MNKFKQNEFSGKRFILNIAVCYLLFSHALNKFLKSFSKFSSNIMEMLKESMNDSENSEEPIRQLIPTEMVGISSLPDQMVKKMIKEGFAFNIMLIGETGIGKSTLISSLFNIAPPESPETYSNSEVKLSSQTYDLCEKGLNLKLTVIETIGYGDQINRIDNVKPIVNYIDLQFEKYLFEELSVNRSFCNDTRIHLCLYFICPTGHNLKALDVFCLKELTAKVNIVPLVAKSDSLSKEDLKNFKMSIKSTMKKQGIKVYQFPDDDGDEVESDVIKIKSNDYIPFAVAASKDYVPVEGKLARARIFPWGTMLVEDEEHSDFLALKHAFIETNMEDIREKTHSEYYERYRRNRLIQLGFKDSDKVLSHQEILEHQSKTFEKAERQLQEKYIEKSRAAEEHFKNLENVVCSKYNSLFEQLKEEEEDIRRLRGMLDLDRSSLKKAKMIKQKSK